MAGEGNTELEVACTAQCDADGNAPNILFTPPCVCPACVPDELPARDDEQKHLWLSAGGRRVRFDIERVELGAGAKDLL